MFCFGNFIYVYENSFGYRFYGPTHPVGLTVTADFANSATPVSVSRADIGWLYRL